MSADDLAVEVREWLTESWSPELTLREWWRQMFDAGFSAPTLPAGFGGRSLSGAEARAVSAQFGRAEVIGPPRGPGQSLGAKLLLAHGTPEQQRELLPPLYRGEDMWVQLFSEPGSGSDLASLATKAEPDGDEFIVNGQKVWSSGADRANRGFLLTRTNWDAPKHRGISYFIIDLDQPGVEVRPMKCMNGDEHFCEVFFDDARVPASRLIGDVDEGWRVAQATLAAERGGLGGAAIQGIRNVIPGEKHGLLDTPVGEILAMAPEPPLVRRFYSEPRELIEIARRRGLTGDPVVRQQLAAYHTDVELLRLTVQRMKDNARAGRKPGPEALTTKIALGNNIKRFREIALELLGPAGQLLDTGDESGDELMELFLWSFAGNIGGGTDEVQRNIAGENGLGLPREPSSDRDVSYRDLLVGTQRGRERADP
jgi:alkylation response protein AidB-like acyl-CoA dehydrogenase